MKTLIGLGALVTSSLFFVGHAEESPGRKCDTGSVPASPPAAGVRQTTTYSSAYQVPEVNDAAAASARVRDNGLPSPALDRSAYLLDYHTRYRHGRR